ncbi:hypothetical protein B0H14DRAFT_3427931 [Mycena olivaceomarginata]|nr:hypothetical protein B0H14DRAFT_3427931 [Mycena olivaceomarginata]
MSGRASRQYIRYRKFAVHHSRDYDHLAQTNPFAFWITRRSAPHTTPLFDTRVSSLPETPINPVISGDTSTALDGFPLVFEDQYIQLASALPLGANVYGLGEVIASSGIRRDVGTEGGVGAVQTNWAREIEDPIDENMYGIHPIYMEHRLNTTRTSQSHGFSPALMALDILLLTPPNANVSLIEYRLLGGTFDLYFLSGPTPLSVMEQYGEIIGTPTWLPYWGFGFHLCRWGDTSVNATKEVVARCARRISRSSAKTISTVSVLRASNLSTTHGPTIIPIVDAAIGKTTDSTDIYEPYSQGANLDVFIKNPDGTQYIGQVLPDWFPPNTLGWWIQALKNWSAAGVELSGIWLDMNEASSFCDGSCGTVINISNTSMPFLLPSDPGNPITDYPEGYNATISGPSGNITVNGTLTYGATSSVVSTLSSRRIGTGGQTDVDLNIPPYAIHNGFGRLSKETGQGPFSLLVTQCLDGHAFGTTYLNDGVFDPPGPSRIVTVHSGKNSLNISTAGAVHIPQKLAEVTILGVMQQPSAVLVDGETKSFTYVIPQQKLVISKLRVDLNTETTIEWK